MNKKRICIVCVIMVFGIMAGCFLEEKYENHIPMEPDVVSSISMNQDQYLTIVANRDKIEDKEEFAELLVKMCRENSFHTIKFSTDREYATGIHMQVYLCDNDIEVAKMAMKIDYLQREYNENYDICYYPEEFVLYVDGEAVK